MIKKILIVIIIGNLVLAGWLFRDFFKSFIFQSQEIVIDSEKLKKSEELEKTVIETKKEEPLIKDLNIAVGEIKSVNWSSENGLIYYNQNNFLETDLKGSYKTTLSSYPFQDLKTIQCSKSRKFCLILSEGFSVYNLETKENNKLPQGTVDASLNHQGDGIIYLVQKEMGRYQLYSSDLLVENQVSTTEMEGKNLKIAVNPQNNTLAYYSKNATKDESGIFLTDLTKEEQKTKIVNNDIIDIQWSPDGKKILFSFYDHTVSPKRVQLGYYDLNQGKYFNLGLPGISQKCAWGKDSLVLYCGVLASTEPQEFLLDDWYSRKFVSQDVFWKIDLLTAERKKIFDDAGKYPAVDSFDLFVEGQELFFGDKISGNLIKRELQ